MAPSALDWRAGQTVCGAGTVVMDLADHHRGEQDLGKEAEEYLGACLARAEQARK